MIFCSSLSHDFNASSFLLLFKLNPGCATSYWLGVLWGDLIGPWVSQGDRILECRVSPRLLLQERRLRR